MQINAFQLPSGVVGTWTDRTHIIIPSRKQDNPHIYKRYITLHETLNHPTIVLQLLLLFLLFASKQATHLLINPSTGVRPMFQSILQHKDFTGLG